MDEKLSEKDSYLDKKFYFFNISLWDRRTFYYKGGPRSSQF
jgi:hypothetical protein